MSKQTIDGVPRELLRWMHDFINDGLARSKEEVAVSEQLRALLTKPAAQHQGEPVGWYKPHWNGNSAEWRLGAELTDAVFTEMWEPLYTRPAEQPSCVTDLERFESDGEDYVKVSDVIDMLGNLKTTHPLDESNVVVIGSGRWEFIDQTKG